MKKALEKKDFSIDDDHDFGNDHQEDVALRETMNFLDFMGFFNFDFLSNSAESTGVL